MFEMFRKFSGNCQEKSQNCFGQMSDGERIPLEWQRQDLRGGGLFRLLPFTCTGICAKPDHCLWLSAEFEQTTLIWRPTKMQGHATFNLGKRRDLPPIE